MCAEVHQFVSRRLQGGCQLLFKSESAVVGRKSDPHRRASFAKTEYVDYFSEEH
jgi:hypothetical protein